MEEKISISNRLSQVFSERVDTIINETLSNTTTRNDETKMLRVFNLSLSRAEREILGEGIKMGIPDQLELVRDIQDMRIEFLKKFREGLTGVKE